MSSNLGNNFDRSIDLGSDLGDFGYLD